MNKKINGYDFIVIVDTREKKTKVIEYLEKHNIKYVREKLAFGDYSLYLKKNDTLVHCGNKFALERKANLDELIQNVARKEHRKRFIEEFEQAKKSNAKVDVFIEEENWHSKMLRGDYFSKTPIKAIRGYIAYFQQKYSFTIAGIDKDNAGAYVVDRLIYFAKDYIDKEGR